MTKLELLGARLRRRWRAAVLVPLFATLSIFGVHATVPAFQRLELLAPSPARDVLTTMTEFVMSRSA